MTTSIYGIGVSGLNAAQAGLVTTGHNISNASTPGFSRQRLEQSAVQPLFTGSGFFGQGVQVASVRRAYNEFLDSQVLLAQTQSSYLDAYNAQISQIDNLLADPASGLSPALQDFFKGVQDVAANPASVPSRQVMLSSASSLVTRFQSLNTRLAEIRDGVNSELSRTTAEINSISTQLANLNQKIVLAQSAGTGQPANDLLDQRDALVRDLNKLVQATVVKQNDGTYNVFIGNGQSLVVGFTASQLTTIAALDDPQRLEVAYVTPGGNIPFSSDVLQGGSLGGILAFSSGTLDSAQNSLGRIAISLAQTFNNQHQLGQDLNGMLGGNFFSVPQPEVTGKSSNSGNGVISAALSSASALTTSDYRLSYSGGTYTLQRLSDNTNTVFTTFPQTVDGMTLTLASGMPANGDSFLIKPTRNGARDLGLMISDTAKIAAAAPIRTAAAQANTGSGKISAGTVNPLPLNANLQQPVTITFTSATTFNVTGTGAGLPAMGVAYTEGSAISYNGWTVEITGVPASGDVFTIGANTGGVSDNRNALLLAGLQTQNTMAGGTVSYQGGYSQMVSEVGNKAREIQVSSKAQANLLADTTKSRESFSGVNLDEEAANLIRYQQAYQASGKMMQVATVLFDTLLGLGH
ncbi:MAG: flagellar hook-associated protein FlgK [Pseudomonadota bacterium]